MRKVLLRMAVAALWSLRGVSMITWLRIITLTVLRIAVEDIEGQHDVGRSVGRVDVTRVHAHSYRLVLSCM